MLRSKNYMNQKQKFAIPKFQLWKFSLVMRIWLQNVLDWLKCSNLSPKLFCDVIVKHFYHLQVLLKIVKKHIYPPIYFNDLNLPRDEFLWSEKLFHKKYEFWRIFEYPSYCHIFNRSEVTPSFQCNCTSLPNHNSMYHINYT